MEQGGDSESLFQRSNIPQLRVSARQLPYSGTSIERPGWSPLLILAGVVTTLGLSLPVGYNIGVVNTPASIIQQFCIKAIELRYGSTFSIKDVRLLWSFIVSIFLVGAAVGSLSGSVLADKIGRKGVLIVCSVLGALAALLFVLSKPLNSIELLLLARLTVGLCSGLTTTVIPMYLTELAPLQLRGSTGVLCPLGVTIGVLFGQVVSMHDLLGNEKYWSFCLAAYVIPLLLCALSLPILPESPKYLFVIRNLEHEAYQALQKLRNVSEDSLTIEIEALRKERMENVKLTVTWNLMKVIKDHSLLLPLLLVCSLQAGQQLSGINAVFYYSNVIFKQAGLSERESELATIGSGICNCFMAILSVWTMSRFKRRCCIQISTLSSAAFLILLGISIKFIDSVSWMPYISIVGVLGYVICYGFGLGPIPYFVGSELFEVGPRPSAMALGSMSSWGGNFVVGLTFPLMVSSIGPASFFLFAAVVVGLFAFLRLYLPETQGKDIREIVELCNQGFASKPLSTSQRNAPECQKMYEKGMNGVV